MTLVQKSFESLVNAQRLMIESKLATIENIGNKIEDVNLEGDVATLIKERVTFSSFSLSRFQCKPRLFKILA